MALNAYFIYLPGMGRQSEHSLSTCAEATARNLAAVWPRDTPGRGGSPAWGGRYFTRTKSTKETCDHSRVVPCNLARDLRLPHLHLKAIMEM